MADYPKQDRKAGLPRTRVGGRYVTSYSPELALHICEKVAGGNTLQRICEEEGMPTRQTFHRWVIMHQELAQAYYAAREASAYSLEEEALEMGRALSRDKDASGTKVRSYEVAMNQLRWSASRRNPRVFSERGSVTVTVPIQINTSLDLGQGTALVAPDHPNVYELKAANVIEQPSGTVDPVEEMLTPSPNPLIPASMLAGAPSLHSPHSEKAQRRAKMEAARQAHGEVGPKADRARQRNGPAG